MNPTPSTGSSVRPSHEQISERARTLWQQRGQPSGQDDEIWFEAERQVAEEAERNDSRRTPQPSPASVASSSSNSAVTEPAKAGKKKGGKAGR